MDWTLTPAYGRDYKSKAAAMKDFLLGKDFIKQPEGRYANIHQISAGDEVKIRYKQLRMIHLFTLTKEMKDGKTEESN